MERNNWWKRGLACAVVFGMIAASAGILHSRARTEAVGSDVEVVIDCAPGGGVDAVCNLPGGTTSTTVDVLLRNTTGLALAVVAFNVRVRADQTIVVAPPPAPCSAPKLNCNPNFNQAGMSGSDWACDPALADQNPDPLITDSFLACVNNRPGWGHPRDRGHPQDV